MGLYSAVIPQLLLIGFQRKGPMNEESPILHSYKLHGSTTVTLEPNSTSRILHEKVLGWIQN